MEERSLGAGIYSAFRPALDCADRSVAAEYAGERGGAGSGHHGFCPGGGEEYDRVPQFYFRPSWEGDRRGLVESVCAQPEAYLVFDEQELYRGGGGFCGGGEEAEA